MKHILTISSVVASVLLLASCTPEEKQQQMSTTVRANCTEITFEAKGNQPQVVTVYADAAWQSKAPEWISIDPTSGNGTVDVTVIVSDNYSGTEMLGPREDTLVFFGNATSRWPIVLKQKGDTYKGAPEVTVAGLYNQADGKAVSLSTSQVMAKSASGVVVSGEGKNAFVYLTESCAIGDNITLKGLKDKENGIAVIKSVEGAKTTAGTVSYPQATDISNGIKDYAGTAMDYIFVAGQVKVVGGAYNVVTKDESAALIFDYADESALEALKGHNVEITGYTFGKNGSTSVRVIVANLTDKGVSTTKPEKPLRAKWRFTPTTMTAYVDLFGGTAGIYDKTAGDGGLYVPSNAEGDGKITWVQVDKKDLDPDNVARRMIGSTGHPLIAGCWLDDYFLFSASDGWTYEVGTKLHIKFMTRSDSGPKYWMLEYWDGEAWQPAQEYPIETETNTGNNDKYNFANPTANIVVECNWVLKAPCATQMFRMRVASLWSVEEKKITKCVKKYVRISDNGDGKEDAGPVLEVIE